MSQNQDEKMRTLLLRKLLLEQLTNKQMSQQALLSLCFPQIRGAHTFFWLASNFEMTNSN